MFSRRKALRIISYASLSEKLANPPVEKTNRTTSSTVPSVDRPTLQLSLPPMTLQRTSIMTFHQRINTPIDCVQFCPVLCQQNCQQTALKKSARLMQEFA